MNFDSKKKKKKFNVYDLFRDLEKFYGILYMLLLAFLILLGSKYVKTLDYNKLFSAPGLLAADSNMRVALPVKKGQMTPPVDVIKFSTESPELIAKGKELYSTNCVSCHGETGEGNGSAGAALNPPPRNFVNPKFWKNSPSYAGMYVTLEEGIANTGMASFSNIPPEDRFALIQYIHTFNPTFPKADPDSMKALDEKYSLSTGVKAANQIPLNLAMELEILNNDTLTNDLKAIASNIASDKNDTAASIVRSLFLNENKALYSLSSNMKWTESSQELLKFLSVDPVDKGFKASVYQIGATDADRIYVYLKNMFMKNKL
ncbi:MAG TPA: cytochrome c [Ignavibacteria bacterium]|nr:cytochrome c [Ignavibacteria bacterium]